MGCSTSAEAGTTKHLVRHPSLQARRSVVRARNPARPPASPHEVPLFVPLGASDSDLSPRERKPSAASLRPPQPHQQSASLLTSDMSIATGD